MNLWPLSIDPTPAKTQLDALEFRHPGGGSLVQLATTDLTDAYQDYYQQRGFTHIGTTMVAVGPRPDPRRFPQAAIHVAPEYTDQILAAAHLLEAAPHAAPHDPDAADIHLRVASQLLPGSLFPLLWDEAARIFISIGDYHQAKDYFDHARSIESREDHTPDRPDAGRAAMLSRDFYTVFAAHGLATVTDITTAIETYFIPAADFAGGLELLVAPATGGASIIANTVSLLHALADASSISPNDADRQLIHRLAHTTDGYHHLPKRCFDNLRGNLASAIATSTTAKERLIEIRPINLNIDDYLELLWQSGAWGQLETNPGRTPWLIEREIWRNTNSWEHRNNLLNHPTNIVTAVLKAGDMLAGYDFDLTDKLPLNLIDALCAVGAIWNIPDGCTVNWGSWFNADARRDLVALAADSKVSAIAAASLTPTMIHYHQDLLQQYPGAAQLLQAAEASQESMPDIFLSDQAADLLERLLRLRHYDFHGKTGADYCADVTRMSALLRDPTMTIEGAFYFPGWLAYLGREQTLIDRITGRLLDPELVRDIITFLRSATHMGVLCTGWRHRINTDDTWRESYVTWENNALLFRGAHVLINDATDTTALELEPATDRTLSAAEFLTQLEELDQLLQHRQADAGDILADLRPQAERIAAHTTLTEPAALYFLAINPHGVLNGIDHISPEHRKLLKFTAVEAEAAYKQVRYFDRHAQLFDAHLTPDTIVDYWEHTFGKPLIHLDAATYTYLTRLNYSYGEEIELALTQHNRASALSCKESMDYFTILVHLADRLPGDHPGRPIVADKLAALKDAAQQHIAAGDWPEVNLSVPLADWQGLRDLNTQFIVWQPIRVLTENHCDELIASLRQPSVPEPHNPQASVPDLVTAVCSALNLEPDSAAYFLQILTLVEPSDANVRQWNNWKKTTLDAAAQPLVEQGLLVVDKQPRTGRSRFLPGKWMPELSKQPGITEAMEQRKRPLYLLWNSISSHSHPMISGCPPIRPIPKLFEQAWRLYCESPE